jgi:hypothetical protein
MLVTIFRIIFPVEIIFTIIGTLCVFDLFSAIKRLVRHDWHVSSD